jgi:hypothetical protein
MRIKDFGVGPGNLRQEICLLGEAASRPIDSRLVDLDRLSPD